MAQPDLVVLHAPSVYDFRQETVLYGPISDLVPSTPIFEMYPFGFVTLSAYLEQYGFHTRIINLAVRMLRDSTFDAEKMIASLEARAFAIDLHWLPHAQGAIEIARLVKKCHPETPVICGGFSSSYFHRELMTYLEVDFVFRGDSTEEPLRLLMAYLRGDDDAPSSLAAIPNLVWRERGETRINSMTYVPHSLDDLAFDYQSLLRSVVHDRVVADYLPFASWLDYPIMGAFICRGCKYRCVTCGGSAYAFREFLARKQPAFRSPEKLASDVHAIHEFSNAPVFVVGDLRQPGAEYARRFLRAMAHPQDQVMIELFAPAPRSFFREVAHELPNFVLEVSLESHDPVVRRAYHKNYSNHAIERTIEHALEAGCHRLDVFFMIGLPQQTYRSVMETIDYAGDLLARYGAGGRLHPFISPLAPFLDPGSLAFEKPDRYGYHVFARTLEEHRQRLVAPSWKYVLNYETRWLNRDEIVAATYEAGRRLNVLKAQFGLIAADAAERTNQRIGRAVDLIAVVDGLMQQDATDRARELVALKGEIDSVNESTVCDKSELDLPLGFRHFNPLTIVRAWLDDTVAGIVRGGKSQQLF